MAVVVGAGLLIQVTVTIGIALGVPVSLGDRSDLYQREMNGHECVVWHMWGLGYRRWYVRWGDPDEVRKNLHRQTTISSTRQPWIDAVLRDEQQTVQTARRIVDRRGFPFQGMYSIADEASFRVLRGIPVRGSDLCWIDARFAMPTGVIIIPFLANTLVYGVATVGLLWSARRVRWWRRVRRGRCGACGYTLGLRVDAGCPECGSNRR